MFINAILRKKAEDIWNKFMISIHISWNLYCNTLHSTETCAALRQLFQFATAESEREGDYGYGSGFKKMTFQYRCIISKIRKNDKENRQRKRKRNRNRNRNRIINRRMRMRMRMITTVGCLSCQHVDILYFLFVCLLVLLGSYPFLMSERTFYKC